MIVKTILMACAVGLLSCGTTSFRDEIREFIPGVYVTEWKNEFTESTDTLLITSPAVTGSQFYSISKRSFYHQTIDGKDLKAHYKRQEWKGQYNSEVKTLVVEKSGRVLIFRPESKSLIEGTTTYRKIK